MPRRCSYCCYAMRPACEQPITKCASAPLKSAAPSKAARGAEAGVWVIAETHDFQTRFAKIVVTDEAGRYLLPELPKAKYSVWVRGYGLADSPKVVATPGHAVDLDRRSSLRMPPRRRRSIRPPTGTR